eukprot:4801905-Prymnesium_polylepis.1
MAPQRRAALWHLRTGARGNESAAAALAVGETTSTSAGPSFLLTRSAPPSSVVPRPVRQTSNSLQGERAELMRELQATLALVERLQGSLSAAEESAAELRRTSEEQGFEMARLSAEHALASSELGSLEAEGRAALDVL